MAAKNDTNTRKNERDELHRLVRLLSIALLCTVLIMGSISIIAILKYRSANTTIDFLRNGASKQTWKIGDIIDNAEFALRVHGVDVDTVGIPQYLPVPESQQYLVVDLSLANKSEDENTFIPLNTAYLRDSEGRKYDLTVAPTVEYSAAGRIASGDTVRGQIGYLVPQGIGELSFYFEPFANRGDIVIVDLGMY